MDKACRIARLRFSHLALGLVALLLAACGEEQAPKTRAPTPVLTQKALLTDQRPQVALTGTIAAETTSNLGFRLSGRVASRAVDVGDRVEKGQVLATLETREQEADVKAAEAGVQSAAASLRQAQATFERQSALFGGGNATRSSFDDANERLASAKATLATAQAGLGTARDNLANTELRADSAGLVTARNIEAGQVVEAAQTAFTLAEDGARDAVFDIYEALLARPPSNDRVEVSLLSDPSARVSGTVREVSPVIDPGTGSVRVKIALPPDLPAAMTLGAPVSGVGTFDSGKAVALPSAALTKDAGKPAVWVVDPATNKVAPRTVGIAGYRTGIVLLGEGLRDGDIVVTAGGQLLRPGEVVEPRAGPPAPEGART
ncbi:efflux RND transporter periplasmic adaptor subunit [Aureimonas psammosilenae]|uniref:efflux RND transporter periplasmic adaptor subunit n=1 Tax=Aureimonas psammosilenae TaxID=2495496 RepID=UPI0012608C93|nr:efflux RND transporter periplasmic adaptor subunit [Aureimonas psammosilenae]